MNRIVNNILTFSLRYTILAIANNITKLILILGMCKNYVSNQAGHWERNLTLAAAANAG